ncbi:MAG: DUF6526 family protein [Gemmatimonadota bacterium]
MTDIPTQGFRSHARYVPAFHFLGAGILLLNFLWGGYRLTVERSMDRLVQVVLAIGLGIIFYYARTFALVVQDRVIRLEERIRLKALCPEAQHAGIDRLSPSQLIALRFASDGEIPQLAGRVMAENIRDRNQIKSMIQQWRDDGMRA